MKFRVRTTMPLALALALAACAGDPAEQFGRAQEAYAENRYEAARIDLLSALREDSSNAAMVELLARVQLALGDGSGAKVTLDRLAGLNGLPSDAALLYGEAALLRGQFDEALAAVETERGSGSYRIRAIALIGQNRIDEAAIAFGEGAALPDPGARLFADYAVFALSTGAIGRARELANQAIEVDPKQLDALLATARVAVREGDLGLAYRGYSRALQLYPGNRAALVGLAGVLGDLDRLDDMEKLVREAVEATPDDPTVIYLQARLAAERGEWAEVRKIIQPKERQLEGFDYAQVLYGEALLELGQGELARARLQPVVRTSPNNIYARRLLARAQLDVGDARGALATVRPLADRAEASQADLTLAARAARQAGDASAANYRDRARFPSPENIASELAIADDALRNRNWRDAIAAYERIIEVAGERNVLVLNNLAYALSQVGSRQRALDYAKRALRLAPDNPSVLDTTGWLIHQTGGDRNAAIELLEKAVRLSPDNAVYARHLEAARKQ